MHFTSMPLKSILLQRHEKKSTTVSSTHVDATHENPNNNLTHHHDGRFWDAPENFVFKRACCSSMVRLPG